MEMRNDGAIHHSYSSLVVRRCTWIALPALECVNSLLVYMQEWSASDSSLSSRSKERQLALSDLAPSTTDMHKTKQRVNSDLN